MQTSVSSATAYRIKSSRSDLSRGIMMIARSPRMGGRARAEFAVEPIEVRLLRQV